MALTFAPASILGVVLLPVIIGLRTGRTLVLWILGLILLVCALSKPLALAAESHNLAAVVGTSTLAMLRQGFIVTLVATLVESVTPCPMHARMALRSVCDLNSAPSPVVAPNGFPTHRLLDYALVAYPSIEIGVTRLCKKM